MQLMQVLNVMECLVKIQMPFKATEMLQGISQLIKLHFIRKNTYSIALLSDEPVINKKPLSTIHHSKKTWRHVDFTVILCKKQTYELCIKFFVSLPSEV